MLTVQLFSMNTQNGRLDPGHEYEVDFVSLVNSETFGPPPLIAPTRDRTVALAEDGDKVLYINTDLVPAFTIEKDE